METLKALVDDCWHGDVSAFRDAPDCMTLSLDEDDTQAMAVCSSPRIGLNLASYKSTALDHPRLHYLARNYRCFTSPELLKSGRHYTFLGVCANLASTHDVEQAAALVGAKFSTAQSWARSYTKGLQAQDAAKWLGRKTDRASDVLKMLGSVQHLSQRPSSTTLG
jgi:hypothetical protein